MQWYYIRRGQQSGPIDDTELLRLARSGELTPEDMVWNRTVGDKWVLASTVENLFSSPPPHPPVTPPAPPLQTPPAGTPSVRGQVHNRDLMRMARESLQNHWGIAVGAGLLYWVILSGVSGFFPCVGAIACLIIGGPLAVGFNLLFLALVRGAKTDIGQLFAGFKTFGTACAAYLLILLFVFLWCLLLIVPGIIAGYAYSMTLFVIADDPTVQPREAIDRSKEMMKGNKWKLFCLAWRFFGWALLCILTCGIGYIWLGPYIQTTWAHFYEDVRPQQG